PFLKIAGLEEPKRELYEILEFIRFPDKFRMLGAKIPKGIILYGPPGTGKTLLAKSLAQEAEVEFVAVSGSEFVEKYVGMGASRVRELFERARQSPNGAIIFIDEIDSLGRKREGGENHIEKDQTLNQLLVEMDGFNTEQENIIVIGSTNRLDILDPALLRPGRFDRHISISYPSLKERLEILKVHTADKPLRDVNLEYIAHQTSGMTGADLANICNEAAIMAVRNNQDCITINDMIAAMDRIIAGIENHSYLMSEQERKRVACHESGHAVVGFFLGDEQVRRVSILPRGETLGFIMQSGKHDKRLYTFTELSNKIITAMAGRAAEELMFGEVSSGSGNDIQKATDIALKMVSELGMAENRISNCSYVLKQDPVFIYNEVERIVQNALNQAKSIIRKNYSVFEDLFAELLNKESLSESELEVILTQAIRLVK
ncbi:MAG: ATP-dependent zinc metalloprotease FtsH, partial [Syntrophomonadaceae bacterium]|nr:ATP-dependent zinc metalloprotease FtsH [Syntrophomonadaceae bacterium]